MAGNWVEAWSSDVPDALDQLDPVDLDLGDFDGDGDADIAVAFATTDIQGLSQGVVRLLRADWDASGGVTSWTPRFRRWAHRSKPSAPAF